MNTAGHSVPFLSPIEIPHPRQFFGKFLSQDMAMDLGTANTLIYVRRKGIVLNEPSVVAVQESGNKVLAVGTKAKEMFGKTSNAIRCVRPMKDGVIADFEMTSLMIKYMIQQVSTGFSLQRPRIVIGVPSGITQVEKRAVIDAALRSGVSNVMLVEEPMAAAIGAGLPVDQSVANMIVDIGGGTTEVAIISMNGTLYSHSIRVAGDEMDEAIQRHIRREFNLQIGIFEAERIKIELGSALPLGEEITTTVCGRDMATGCPKQIEINDEMVRMALCEPIETIISSITTALEQTNPDIARDVIARGVFLAGGGSLLNGLSERLYRETGIRFYRATDPLSCVVRGVGKVVDNLKEMRQLCIST